MRHESSLVILAASLATVAPACAQSPGSFYHLPDRGLGGEATATTASGLAPGGLSMSGFSPVHSPGAGPTRWRFDEVSRGGHDGGHVDTFRFSITETRVGPAAGVVSGAPYDATGFGLSYSRDWPNAMQFGAGRYGLAVSPSAGFALADGRAIPQAGATLQLGSADRSVEDRLGSLVSDGKKYGDQGRWYLFAAASGRSVGLNMTRADGGWNQSGWSTDKTSKLLGDGQLGVGYRKGAMQASFGYVYREIKVQNGPLGADTDVSDSLAAFSLSIRP